MNKRLFFVAFFILISSILLANTNFTIINKPYFLPENFHVGDRVRCIIEIQTEEDVLVEWAHDNPLLDRLELKILDIQVYSRFNERFEIEITFIPFFSQTRIPSLQIGEVFLPEIPINTFSFLDSENVAFAPLMPQVYLPYTEEIFFGILVFLIALFLAFLFLSKKIRNSLLNSIKYKRRKNPTNEINQKIRLLGSPHKEYTLAEFYTSLTIALREYLEGAMNEDLSFVTTGEMKEKLEHFFSDSRIATASLELFMMSDEVRFGNKFVQRSRMKHDLVVLKRMVTMVEKELTQQAEKIKTQEES